MKDFDTANRSRERASRSPIMRIVHSYQPQIVVALLVVVVLIGGAVYSARLTERAPQVVYAASLEDVAAKSKAPLLVDINSADVEELDELPEVGPSTADEIIAFRMSNGHFGNVDELEEVPGIGPATIEKIKPFATV